MLLSAHESNLFLYVFGRKSIAHLPSILLSHDCGELLLSSQPWTLFLEGVANKCTTTGGVHFLCVTPMATSD